MMPGHALNLLVIYVSNLAASAEFYSALGLHLTREQHGDGPIHYSTLLPGGMILELYPAGDRPVSQVRLGITVPNPAETAEALLALGYGLRGKAILDPDGNVIELRRR